MSFYFSLVHLVRAVCALTAINLRSDEMPCLARRVCMSLARRRSFCRLSGQTLQQRERCFLQLAECIRLQTTRFSSSLRYFITAIKSCWLKFVIRCNGVV